MDRIIGLYQKQEDDVFMNGEKERQDTKRKYWEAMYRNGYFEDPFPPGDTRTGRFRVNHPPYEQKRKVPPHPGKYQRIYNNAMDMFEWQYKPWPTSKWMTYYKVSAEMLHREVKAIGVKLASKKFHTAASHALSEERFYKVERVDTPA